MGTAPGLLPRALPCPPRAVPQCIPCNKTTKKSAEKGLCLKKLSTTNSKFNCDKHDPAGREKIKKGTTMYGCRTCDYDVCIKCWKKFGLKSIKISNPQVSRAASESSFANTSLSSFQAAPAPTYDDGPANQATQQLQRQTQAWDTETRQLEAQLADVSAGCCRAALVWSVLVCAGLVCGSRAPAWQTRTRCPRPLVPIATTA